MKFRGHETFHIRKGWLSKGLRNVVQNPDVFVSRQRNPSDALGLGTNMVRSLRYWLQAVGLTQEERGRKRIQRLTDVGEQVYAHDRYIEEPGTLQLLHYHLVTNAEAATAWYYMFNEFGSVEFTQADFSESLQQWVYERGESTIAMRSIGDDASCIINTYVPRWQTSKGTDDPETNLDCPLSELGLLELSSQGDGVYRKTSVNADQIDPWIALGIIMQERQGKTEVSFQRLLTAPRNIGRIFNLDGIQLLDVLYAVEKTGYLKVIRTAGLDVAEIRGGITLLECVRRYYGDSGRPRQAVAQDGDVSTERQASLFDSGSEILNLDVSEA